MCADWRWQRKANVFSMRGRIVSNLPRFWCRLGAQIAVDDARHVIDEMKNRFKRLRFLFLCTCSGQNRRHQACLGLQEKSFVCHWTTWIWKITSVSLMNLKNRFCAAESLEFEEPILYHCSTWIICLSAQVEVDDARRILEERKHHLAMVEGLIRGLSKSETLAVEIKDKIMVCEHRLQEALTAYKSSQEVKFFSDHS